MNRSKFILISLLVIAILTGCAGQPGSAGNGPQKREYHFRSNMGNGGMQFIGVGGEIADQTNPTIQAKVGDTVVIKLTSGEGIEHNISFPDLNVASERVSGQGKEVTLSFVVDRPGSFPYFCSIPGHREAGMEGKLVVTGEALAAAAQPTQPAQVAGNAAAPV